MHGPTGPTGPTKTSRKPIQQKSAGSTAPGPEFFFLSLSLSSSLVPSATDPPGVSLRSLSLSLSCVYCPAPFPKTSRKPIQQKAAGSTIQAPEFFFLSLSSRPVRDRSPRTLSLSLSLSSVYCAALFPNPRAL
jgi:hypothetical protein